MLNARAQVGLLFATPLGELGANFGVNLLRRKSTAKNADHICEMFFGDRQDL